jgi:hypothetical protein
MYKGSDKQNKNKHLSRLIYKNESFIKVCKKCNFFNDKAISKNKFIFCYKCNNPIFFLS